jgi:phage replication-related protein YjqB (UPF0714/DUF867 family)
MKKDKYRDFCHLANNEVEGAGYRIRTRGTGGTLILAPHGGGIEPGTSELAEAIAADDHSLYIFEGLKASGNEDLHITSSNFDEPACQRMITRAERIVTVHGEERADAVVFIGGLDEGGVDEMITALASAGFVVKAPDKEHLKGQAPKNVCNSGRSGAGVQLEIMEGLRSTFFRALTPRSERQHTTSAFLRFVAAVREALS